MSLITSDHGLLRDTPAPAGEQVGRADGRAPYCYLFEGLAQGDRVGLFTGMDEVATRAALLAFEAALHPAWNTPPPPPMRLPAIYTYFGQFINHDISAPVRVLPANNGAGDVGRIDSWSITF